MRLGLPAGALTGSRLKVWSLVVSLGAANTATEEGACRVVTMMMLLLKESVVVVIAVAVILGDCYYAWLPNFVFR